MIRTPREVGIKKGTVVAPEGGWKPQTYYVVETAFYASNAMFKTLFYSGFLTNGEPCGYNCLLSPTLEEKYCLHDTYCLIAVEELDIDLSCGKPVNEVFMSSAEVKEQALIANELAEQLGKCVDFKPWHINWVTRNAEGVVQAWEPDSTCIYEGSALNAACRALNNSTFGN